MNIINQQKNQVKKLAKKYGLNLVLLFGSRVDDKYIYPESDIDIAILGNQNLDLMQEARINTKLMEIFRTDKIDLTNLRIAPPLLKYEIANNSEILYEEKPDVFDRFEVYAFKSHIEAKPLYDSIEQSVKDFTKNIKVKV